MNKTKKQTKVKYADGFVIVLDKKFIHAYQKISKLAEKVWSDHGALDYKECAGDDLDIKMGMPFPKLVKLKKNETVIFSWIAFSSKAHRNKVNAKVMADPRITKYMDEKKMPFEMKKMSYGGFKVIVSS